SSAGRAPGLFGDFTSSLTVLRFWRNPQWHRRMPHRGLRPCSSANGGGRSAQPPGPLKGKPGGRNDSSAPFAFKPGRGRGIRFLKPDSAQRPGRIPTKGGQPCKRGCTMVRICDDERGLLFKRGNYVKHLKPGTYFYPFGTEIGRASCREREARAGTAVDLNQ